MPDEEQWEVKGTLGLTVANATAAISSAGFKKTVECGIAKVTSVLCTDVLAVLTLAGGRRLGAPPRLLEDIIVAYTIKTVASRVDIVSGTITDISKADLGSAIVEAISESSSAADIQASVGFTRVSTKSETTAGAVGATTTTAGAVVATTTLATPGHHDSHAMGRGLGGSGACLVVVLAAVAASVMW